MTSPICIARIKPTSAKLSLGGEIAVADSGVTVASREIGARRAVRIQLDRLKDYPFTLRGGSKVLLTFVAEPLVRQRSSTATRE